MKERIVTLEVAKLAWEKYFDWETQYFYEEDNGELQYELYNLKNNEENNSFAVAPSQYILQKWLREKHNLNINIRHSTFKQMFSFSITGAYENNHQGMIINSMHNFFDTYEECLEVALITALNLII